MRYQCATNALLLEIYMFKQEIVLKVVRYHALPVYLKK